MNKRNIGDDTEQLACEFISSRGAAILERNYRCRQGEVDIIAKDEEYLCFIEVKYRKNDSFGPPQEAVSYRKRQHICKVSTFYLYSKYKSLDISVRYDVIAISPQDNKLTFNWIKNAFDYC